MTCIVSLAHEGKVYMGADSAGVSGTSLSVRKDAKVFRICNMLMGFTSSFRMGQLLQYSLKIPPNPYKSIMDQTREFNDFEYMCGPFIDAVRSCLKAGGFAKKENEVESGGIFLVGYLGQVYRIDSDYQVAQNEYAFDAVGCGAELALGALHVMESYWVSPEDRVNRALEASERFNASVRRPFRVEVM